MGLFNNNKIQNLKELVIDLYSDVSKNSNNIKTLRRDVDYLRNDVDVEQSIKMKELEDKIFGESCVEEMSSGLFGFGMKYKIRTIEEMIKDNEKVIELLLEKLKLDVVEKEAETVLKPIRKKK